ncbi:hypothetical protein KM043_018584 [Ampulex compressa]|nr:hypothetical protein KM043_018584 [Ampulex compressa]
MKATILLRLLIPFCGFVIANAKDEDTKKKITELNNIRTAVNTTKEEGKETENCFEAATKYQIFRTRYKPKQKG